jgi:hypothetical protein
MFNPFKKNQPAVTRLRGIKQIKISYLFLVLLLGILVLEGLEIKKSFLVVMSLQKQELPISQKMRGVRVNFADYDSIIKRIEQSKNYNPTIIIEKNPFVQSVK